MNQTQINRILNLLLWLSFCLLVATGCLLAFRLPPGSQGGGGLTAWTWSRHDWGDLHRWNSYLFLALIMLHLVLHWRWLWCVAGGRFKALLLAGLIGGALMVAAVWLIPIERGPDSEHGRGQGKGPHDGRGAQRTLTSVPMP